MDNNPAQSVENGDATDSSSSGQTAKQQGQGSSGQPKFSNGPHIRSRITVVCAECKRLKLKCDRRTPCSSCLKRDTVQRCVYSQAAAEKIDVQSLHNRLLVVEGTLAQLSSSSPSTSISSSLSHMTPFKSSYPAASSPFTQISTSAIHSAPTQHSSVNISPSSALAGLPCNDRALLAIGASGSSVVISLEDVASIWLNELDLNLGSDSSACNKVSLTSAFSSSSNPSRGTSGSGKGRVKLEPTPVLLPPSPSISNSSPSSSLSGCSVSSTGNSYAFMPPVPYSTFLPSSATATSNQSHSSPAYSNTGSNYYAAFPSVSQHLPQYPQSAPSQSLELPQVTPALLQHLPSSASTRSRLMRALSETMVLHPCFNVRHFERRVEAMMSWGESPDSYVSSFDSGMDSRPLTKQDLARELFLGPPPGKIPPPKPTLSFFASAAASFALGALITRDYSERSPTSTTTPESGIHGSPTLAISGDAVGDTCNPAALFALSDQALTLFEKTSSYDIDSICAMILQVLYMLHDGQMRVAQGVFPLVGKMINVARMMGLAMDPDEFPGTYNLFDAETRRRVWWDVFYYDLFISDCMGHPPLIADNSFTTKFPSDVDEEKFTATSTSLLPPPAGEESEKGFAYFVLKCRLAQLVKSVKKQTFKDPLSDDGSDLSLDQAAAFESEVTTWLSELPSRYRLDMDLDLSKAPVTPCISPFLLAQRCELAIVSNRLILKLYLPFLRDAAGSGPTKPSHQAVLGTVNAAHSIIYASRLLHSVWKHTRPAAFEFYDFGRTLFDAAVVCAHAVIQQPNSILAAEAMKGVNGALEVMRDLGAAKASIEGGGGECARGEAIKIVEMMKRKAESARSGNSRSEDGVVAGSKRKRSEFEDETLESGFQLPFVGASVSSTKTDQAKSTLPSSQPPIVSLQPHNSGQKSKNDLSKLASTREKEKEKEKEKDKPTKYPAIGIRVRPGQPRPSVRQRTESMAPSSPNTPIASAISSTHHMVQPTATAAAATTVSLVQPTQSATVMQDPTSEYPSYHTSRSQPQVPSSHQPVQQESYSTVEYGGGQDSLSGAIDDRRYSQQSYSSSPQSGPMYDQATNSSPYSTSSTQQLPSYAPAPSSESYYMTYGHSGHPAPYDSSPMGQQQDVSMSEYGHPGPTSMDASIPSTPIEPSYVLAPEKGHPSYTSHPHMSKSELVPSPPMSHQYQQSPTHPTSMTPSHVQSWAQATTANHADMWSYKYYNGMAG